MIKLFIKYVSIGVLNTALHWAIFALCVYGFQTSQALANVAGFAVAVSFSFSLTPGLPLEPAYQPDVICCTSVLWAC